MGYNPLFLGEGCPVHLPEITPEIFDVVLRGTDLREGFILDYPNYSVVMNKHARQALFSAANADFDPENKGSGRSFRRDRRIDKAFQIENEYYRQNVWDRGHLTKREAVAWGPTRAKANKASKDSCFWPNISLQHEKFHHDEWGALEGAIKSTNMDEGEKFNIVTGPIFTGYDRYYQRDGLEEIRIPAAFWKVISYVGKNTGELETNAFLVYQDDLAISALHQVRNRDDIIPFEIFQTSTTLLQELTGLHFPDICFDTNPLFFFESGHTKANKISTPQLVQIRKATMSQDIVFQQ